MVGKITGKDIRKQLAGHYFSYIAVLLIIDAIIIFCAVFCGMQLEWTNPLVIAGIIALAVTLAIMVIMIFKIAKIKDHYIFKRYGSPDIIAENISQGVRSPRCISGNYRDPNKIIVTDKFIVSTINYRYYLELENARYMQRLVVQKTKPIILTGNPVVSAAATVGVNYMSDKYSSNPNYDFLIIWDDRNVRHEYSIRNDEISGVMHLLLEIAPQIEVRKTRPF